MFGWSLLAFMVIICISISLYLVSHIVRSFVRFTFSAQLNSTIQHNTKNTTKYMRIYDEIRLEGFVFRGRSKCSLKKDCVI